MPSKPLLRTGAGSVGIMHVGLIAHSCRSTFAPMLSRSLESLRAAYQRLGAGVMGVRFPLSHGPWNPQQRQVFEALKAGQQTLSGFGRAKSHPTSGDVHRVLADALDGLDGWSIERPNGARLELAREYGLNEEPMSGFVHPDGWHHDSGTILEVERGGAYQTGAVLKRVLERGELGMAEHFIAIVPWQYCPQDLSKTYDYTFREVVQPEYERAALAMFRTYTVFCVGGLLRVDVEEEASAEEEARAGYPD